MNPLTNVRNIKKLSEEELKSRNKTSWHEQYRCSAWIFVGGLPYDLTEGDIICVFSQYGEPVNVNLVRDKETGKSKGFCFICYEDQRSTDLAVDNLNGVKILGRTIRVDHVENYKTPKTSKDDRSEVVSEIHKETLKKTKINQEDDYLTDKESRSDYKICRLKKKEKPSGRSRLHSNEPHNDEKTHTKVPKKRKHVNLDSSRTKKKRKKLKRKLSNSRSPSLSSASSSSTSSTSSSTSSTSSSSSSSSLSSSSSSGTPEEKNKKSKKATKDKNQKQKRNKTIEDLKREARLIQAELRRRQQIEAQAKNSCREFDDQQLSRKKFGSGRGEKDKRRSPREKQEEVEGQPGNTDSHRDRTRRNFLKSSTMRDRRHSKAPERHGDSFLGYRHR